MTADDAAHRLRAMAGSEPPSKFLAMVDSVQANGTVNLSWGGAVVDGVAAGSGYPSWMRKAGDKVVVERFNNEWLITGSAGNNEALPLPSLEEYVLKEDLPRETHVSWGTQTPSGEGWVEVDRVFLRSTSTDLYIYGLRAAAAPPPAPKPGKPKSPVTTTPTAYAAWRDNKRHSGQPPRQSKYASSFGPYMGAWFYGSLRSHTAGQSVKSMSVTLTRSNTANGISGGARVRLCLTDVAKPSGNFPARYWEWSPGTLARGERKTFTLPAAWTERLASGTAKGLVCYSTVQRESIVYSTSAPIRIVFN